MLYNSFLQDFLFFLKKKNKMQIKRQKKVKKKKHPERLKD